MMYRVYSKRSLVIENVSYYTAPGQEMTENELPISVIAITSQGVYLANTTLLGII